MRKPNFFIIGAPKCGTTSLASWLADHSQIFMSPRKEPHHFNTDHRMGRDHPDYEALFRSATDDHRAIGEASIWYMFSNIAVANIEKYTSASARYVVCLRNPVDMAHSLHEQLVVSGHERVTDFERAWALQTARAEGVDVPRFYEPRFLQYGQVCSLGHQLERLYRQVPADRVLPVLLDDMREEPGAVYREVLRFLGVDEDGRTSFPVLNAAKERRSQSLQTVVRQIGNAKRSLGIRRGLGILGAVGKANLRYRPRPPLSEEVRRQLEAYFAQDIGKLEHLLDRNLGVWRPSQGSTVKAKC